MNWRRCHRIIGIAVVLTSLILALTPVKVFAAHTATVTNAPLGADLITETIFTLSVTNNPTSAHAIAQVDLTVDANWTVAATEDQPTTTGWTVSVSGQIITWTGSLAVGSSQDFSWKATTAAAAEYSSHSWTTTDTPPSKTQSGTVETVVSDWDSYKDADCTIQCDNFADYATEHTVYMYGVGFVPSTAYRVIFWDPVDTTWYIRDTVDLISTAGGELGVKVTNPVAHIFVEGTDTDGTWYATVYNDQSYTPATHDPNDPKLVADDSFTVQESAIPEFPTVIAAIAVAGACFGIYYWMRKRKLAYVKA